MFRSSVISFKHVHRYGLIRGYAIQKQTPRDRSITAKTIRLVDADGNFQGNKSLSEALASYDSSVYTLMNMTPQAEIPTCKLFSKTALKEIEAKAYKQKREKSKIGADPSKVLKECTLNWNVTTHDLGHKLESGLSALRKGNKLDILIGMKTRRGAKLPDTPQREALLDQVVSACDKVGREWKTREGGLEKGIILHYIGTPS